MIKNREKYFKEFGIRIDIVIEQLDELASGLAIDDFLEREFIEQALEPLEELRKIYYV